jgi:hypothetical protein
LRGGLDRLRPRIFFRGHRYHAPLDVLKTIFSPAHDFGQKYSVRGLTPYGGIHWFVLPREVLLYINSYTTAMPAYSTFFKHLDSPEEIFFPTLLMNSKYADDIINDNLNFMIWPEETSAHPKVLTIEDFDSIKVSHTLFARKVNEVNSRTLLERIDNELLSL